MPQLGVFSMPSLSWHRHKDVKYKINVRIEVPFFDQIAKQKRLMK